ncbi:MAG: non-canonical purine NTP pyrophosphatase [Rhodovarius sp.]|nr:non-canonical purine NTP pyrophosphatase [Rhodovarius sp.]
MAEQANRPRRLPPGSRLVLATHNPGKLRELRRLFEPFGVELIGAGELGLPAPAETGASLEENAAIKALAAARATGLPALADDSGFFVAALGGAPGVKSADWAMLPDGRRDYRAAMARIAREAAGNPDRRAAFRCVLALAWPDGHVDVHPGEVVGSWVHPPRGEGGFGYDPMFIPAHSGLTFGEMTPAEKSADDHRSRAFAALAAAALG